ncbi:11141_t:CDS:2 [Diversispora eburnea]|uniref:11141_t:CDS:1 n=1 Tax=Diversispora eburnea TaxID=1213867 RepID=A0A9N8VAZ9_9GLOM|nr:11141_t:CDS:2 [Diversispora eburnea]
MQNQIIADRFDYLSTNDNNDNRSYSHPPKPSLTLQDLIPEVLESILIFLPFPNTVAPVCKKFSAIVLRYPSFKRRWLRLWLHPKLPDAFLPTYAELCKAVSTQTPFNILIQIIDLQKLCNRLLASSVDGSVTKLLDVAYLHKEKNNLIPFLIHRGLNIKRYIKDHTSKDDLRTEGGTNLDNKSTKEYLLPLVVAVQNSKWFKNELACSKDFFTETELAFAIVLHERLDVASVVAVHPQHTLDILEESVDRIFTTGIAWAFQRGVGEAQRQNPLYLRLCIEKADVISAKVIIENGANINISPSAHTVDLTSYGSTSLLEFTDPNADNGRPLALCVTNHHWELTYLLLSHGADVNCDERIAVRIATELGYKDMAKIGSGSGELLKGMVKRMSFLGRSIRRKSESDGDDAIHKNGNCHKNGASRG